MFRMIAGGGVDEETNSIIAKIRSIIIEPDRMMVRPYPDQTKNSQPKK